MAHSEIIERNEALEPLRRAPVQKRSREKVERFLEIATALIAERGSDSLKMSEIAGRAGVAIGSLYQYFPDKGAVIRTLAERCNAQGHRCVAEALAGANDEASLRAALAEVTDGYYAMFAEQPVMRDIWSATLADKALQEIDAADGRAHAAALEETMELIWPEGRGRCGAAAFLAMHLIAATVRQAVALPAPEARALIDAFKTRVIAPMLLAPSPR